MPPHLELNNQYSKVTIGLKRKLEDDPLSEGGVKKRAEDLSSPLSNPNFTTNPDHYPIEFSPPRDDHDIDQNDHHHVVVDVSSAAHDDNLHPHGLMIPDDSSNDSEESSSQDSEDSSSQDSLLSDHHLKVSPLREEEDSYLPDDLRASTQPTPLTPPPSRTSHHLDDHKVPVNRSEPALEQYTSPPVTDGSRPPSNLEEPLIMSATTEDKESQHLVCLKTQTESATTLVDNQNFESILQKTLLATRSGAALPENNKIDYNNTSSNTSAKVIVEHLPSMSNTLYELDVAGSHHHEDTSCLLGGSLDINGGGASLLDDAGCEDDLEDESDDESSMFDTPPPANKYDRFWSSSTNTQQSSSSNGSANNGNNLVSTYQFLDQHNNQRIECDAENGKSYLQLGTVNHHHNLPVTPVLQPKPTTLTPRHQRPLNNGGLSAGGNGLCRSTFVQQQPPRPPNPTPPILCCEQHPLGGGNPMSLSPLSPVGGNSGAVRSSCSASCSYRQQRSDMLSLSLHKLHTARQRSDSSLRRSVLICNMLRYIELESTTEQHQRQQQMQSHHAMDGLSYASAQDSSLLGGGGSGSLEHTQQQSSSPYWSTTTTGAAGPGAANSNNSVGLPNFSSPVLAPPTPNPYMNTRETSNEGGSSNSGYSSIPVSSSSQLSSSNLTSSSCDTNSTSFDDAPLKDFNSAFRQSSSTPPPPVPLTSSTNNSILTPSSICSSSAPPSSPASITSSSSSLDDSDRSGGINWSSVLSLTSQNELDPLNNNSCYSDHHAIISSCSTSLIASASNNSSINVSSSSNTWTTSTVNSGSSLMSMSDHLVDLSQAQEEAASSGQVSVSECDDHHHANHHHTTNHHHHHHHQFHNNHNMMMKTFPEENLFECAA